MSIRAMNWVWSLPVTGSEKLVLLCLADHADNDGVCWPGLSAVAEKTGISARQVIRVVFKLEAARLVEVAQRKSGGNRQQTNRYRLDIDDARLGDPGDMVSPGNVEKPGDMVSLGNAEKPGDMVSLGNAEKPGDIFDDPGDIQGKSRVTIMSPGTTKNVRTTREPSIEPSACARGKIKLIENRITGLPEDLRKLWMRAFPGVNIDAELVKAELWLTGPPKRHRPNLKKFLENWLAKADPSPASCVPPIATSRVCNRCSVRATIFLAEGDFCRTHNPLNGGQP